MKWLAFVFPLIVSCSPPPVTIFQRYATVRMPNNLSSGSAVSLGKGYFFTARHVITSDSFTVFNARGKDKKPLRIFEFDDVVFFKADIDTNFPEVQIAEPKIGEGVYIIQPIFSDSGVNIFLFQGNIAHVSDFHGTIDRPIFSGISGSGVFNKKGELIGVASQLYGIQGQVAFGIFVKVIVFEPMLRKAR
mgnify:CR=1 FL=1